MESVSLSKTKRFDVWTNGKITSLNKFQLSTKLIKKVSFADVAAITFKKFDVELETKEISYSPGVSVRVTPLSATNFYPKVLCRAALAVRLISVLPIADKFHPTTIDRLVQLLNADAIPALSGQGTQLLGSLCGAEGYMYYLNDSLSPAAVTLQRLRLGPLTVPESESVVLDSDSAVWLGIGCIAAAAVAHLPILIDCISALSCEAAGASSGAFDPQLFEDNRPHRGQMASAGNLRLLLEGSKRGLSAHLDVAVSRAYDRIPQSTGPAADYLSSARRALEIELNSAAAGGSASVSSGENVLVSKDAGAGVEGKRIVFERSEARMAVRTIIAALELLLEAALERVHHLRCLYVELIGTDPLPAVASVDSRREDEVSKLWSLLTRVTKVLTMEACYSIAILEAQSERSGGKDDKGDIDEDEVKLKEDDKSAEVGVKAGSGKERRRGIDLSTATLTPAQRAKVEAKQRAKAEKKAAKQARRGAAEGSDRQIPLAPGAEAVRNLLLSKMSGEGSTQLGLSSGRFAALHTAMDLWATDEGALVVQLARLLDSLASGGRLRPKIAKGARDFGPEQMRVREQAFAAIRRVFRRHGAVEIDTPVFELREVLTGKYGEDSKLIYHLEDQGGELLSLRYDLTVPFARYLAMNSMGNIKRFHIAKVYRRDQPQPQRGRYREFYQCDFDIAGTFAPMAADAEAVSVGAEVLAELPVGSFLIKLNHRKLLDAVFEISGVPPDRFRPICSAVDKLDKATWAEVREEMVVEKGLAPEAADRIGEFVLLRGPPLEMLARLTGERLFGEHAGALEALKDLDLLFCYLQAMGALQHVSLDLSLARGLDYYTGVIYEAVLTDGTAQVGSIAAGGRYDRLVGMFSASGTQIPCVGISIGIERIFAILERRAREAQLLLAPSLEVYVASVGEGLVAERMRVARALWAANIPSEYSHQERPKLVRQLEEVLARGVPFMVVVGEEECARGTVRLKDMRRRDEQELALEAVVPLLLERGCRTVPATDQRLIDSLRAEDNGSSS